MIQIQKHRVNGSLVATEMRQPSVTRIVYERRFNLNNYEHETVTVEATVAEGSSPVDELLAVRQLVAEHCTLRLQAKARALAAQKTQENKE